MPVSKPIAVYADVTKGCIFFDGSTVSPKFLGTVIATAHPTETNRIVIQRTDRLESDGITFRRMFKRMRIDRITNEAGVYLADSVGEGGLGYTRAQVVDYINGQSAERIDPQEAQYLGVWDADTNTPDLSLTTPDAGDFYFVSVPGSTVVDGINQWSANDRILYNGTAWEKVPAARLIAGVNRSVLLNTNPAYYGSNEAGTGDPLNRRPGWYYKNTENNSISWHIFGDNQNIDYQLGDFSGFYAVIDFRNTTSAPFFTLHTTPQEDGLDAGVTYRSRVHYFDASAVNAALVAGASQTPAETTFLVHSADLTGADLATIRPELTRIPLAVDTEATEGPQNATEELYLMTISTRSNQPEGTEEFVVESVGYQVGDVRQEYQLTSPPVTSASITAQTPATLDFRHDVTGTTILLDDGRQYGANSIHAVDNGDGTIDILAVPGDQVIYNDLDYSNLTINNVPAGASGGAAANALNALFQSTPIGAGNQSSLVYPLLDIANTTAAAGAPVEGQTPTTTKSDGTTLHYYTYLSDDTGHGARYWSTETLDTPSEYFTVRIAGSGRFLLGFADGTTDSDESGTADDIEELQNNAGSPHSGLIWAQAFYDYGAYTAPWTWYGVSSNGTYGPGWTGAQSGMMRHNNDVQQALNNTTNSDGALFKVGIDLNGYMAVWYWDEGRSDDWILCSRRHVTTDANKDYHLVVKLWDGNTTLVEIPQFVERDDSAPILSYRYIESPDGQFYYPLFASADEAAYVDVLNGGTDPGSAHAHVFVDEPTSSVWYMPDNGGTHAGPSAPSNTETITYTEIPTNADNLYAPGELTLSDQTFAEAAAVNLQIQPQDQTPVAVVTGLPEPLVFQNGVIQGTTRYVTGDQTYTITVERSNNYGTTTQTFDLTITDNTSLNTITGWTALKSDQIAYQPDNIPHYSPEAAFDFDLTLDQGTEFTWTQTNGTTANGGPGQFMQFGIVASGVDKATATLAGNTNWDLKGVLWAASTERLTGWVNNTYVNTGSNDGVTWKLAYEQDGADYKIVLYRSGVEVARSADAYTGNQTITVVYPEGYTASSRLPAISKTLIGAGSTTPPVGFADPLLVGEMASTTLMGDHNGEDAAVGLDDTLDVNYRYIFPQTWLEANVLPYMTEAADEAFFGVPVASPGWADVGNLDWDAAVRLEGQATATHYSKLLLQGVEDDTVLINSETDAFYDYAVEWDGTDLHVIACNVNHINNQPSVSNGGSFSRTSSILGYTNQTGSLPLAIGVDGGAQVNLSTSGLQSIRIPFGARDILVGENSNGTGDFSGLQPAASKYDEHNGGHAPSDFTYTAPTINAGYTYRFIYHPSMESGDYIEFRLASDGTTVYSTGVTTFGSGDPDFTGAYKGVQFAVPSDAPPLKIFYYNSFTSSFDSGRDLPISGSTYTVGVTGVTQEGPAANQTNTNLFDSGDHGWISVDEQLGAGERLVLDTAFLADLVDAMPDNSAIFIGAKDTGWTDSNDWYAGFEGGFHLTILRYSSSDVRLYAEKLSPYTATSTYFTTVANITAQNVSAFLEITNSGNNIRAGIRADNLTSSDSAASTAYADWNSSYKDQTGTQSFGITTVDVVMQGRDMGSPNAAMDAADVDWTGLSEISVPTPAATLTTSWTKALDFSGSSERCIQVTNTAYYLPLRMSGISTNVPANTTAGYTSDDVDSRPWATAIVFNSDGNSSNQHIWNMGEGAGSTDDNIYLRVDASGNLYFGWGRSGEINECHITAISSNTWYGIYIASTGERLGGGHTAAQIADCFDIRMVNLQTGATGSNLSTATNWTNGSFGGRMNRQFTGDMTIGGRGSNRNFHGKVAAMVVTTLRRNVAMPTDAEISMMVRDPEQWLQDYMVGNPYRLPINSADSNNFQLNANYDAIKATQVWLMGDGTSDAYSQIRNQVWAAAQNYTPMNMISMVSNDIETVTISGLS